MFEIGVSEKGICHSNSYVNGKNMVAQCHPLGLGASQGVSYRTTSNQCPSNPRPLRRRGWSDMAILLGLLMLLRPLHQLWPATRKDNSMRCEKDVLQRECQAISSVSRSDSFKILHNSRIVSVNLVPLSSGLSSPKKPLASHLIRATSLGEAFLNDTRPELTFGLTQGVDAPQTPKEPIGQHPQQPQLQFISVRYISALSSRQAGSTYNGIKNWAWYPLGTLPEVGFLKIVGKHPSNLAV